MADDDEKPDTTPDENATPDPAPETQHEPGLKPNDLDVDMTEEDYALLTDEERAAMAEDDETEPEPESEDQPEAASDDPAPKDQPDDDRKTPPPTNDLNDLAKQIEDKDAEQKALFDKYRDGELEDEEYQEQLAALQAEARDLAGKRAVAEAEAQRALSGWRESVQSYAKLAPALFEGDHLDRWDAHVRRVTSDAAYDNLSDRQKLTLAHRNYLNEAELLGVPVPPLPGQRQPAADPAPPKDDDAARQPTETAPRREAPRTIKAIPASDVPAPNESRFAHLDALMGDPDRFESALAQLTEEEREAYASMGG